MLVSFLSKPNCPTDEDMIARLAKSMNLYFGSDPVGEVRSCTRKKKYAKSPWTLPETLGIIRPRRIPVRTLTTELQHTGRFHG
jgi:hypothetical protein